MSNTLFTSEYSRRTVLRTTVSLAGAAMLPSLAWSTGAARAATNGVLRVVPQADLKILDPIWTTAQITANHGYMVYDTLFAMDGKLQPQPQMVDRYEISDNGKTYRFSLRDGLKWTDGTPVTARDCVASIKRWSVRSAEGRVMAERGASWVPDGDRSFTLKLDEPFGMVLLALANPVNPCFMMREKEASIDPHEQVRTVVGSGPFIFEKDKWRPGHEVVYRRNPDYVPRSEPADGLAGGKVARVEQVVWRYVPDSGTATSALQVGEVDMLEFPAHDLIPLLQTDPNVAIKVIDPIGYQGMLRMNCLIPPFDNAKARQALLHLVQAQQDAYLAAMIGLPDYQRTCLSPFVCGSPSESDVGLDAFTKDGLNERVKGLLKEAGYGGEPIVIMDPTDQHVMHMMVQVAAQHLRQVGVNVDLQAMDWGTLTSRRPIKKPPSEDKRGWHIFPTWWPGFTMQNPITNIPLETSCAGDNWYGWPCDEKLESLRVSYVSAQTDEERSAVIDKLQQRFFEVVPYVYVGQFFRPVAYRKDRIKGVIGQQSPVFWNIEKIA